MPNVSLKWKTLKIHRKIIDMINLEDTKLHIKRLKILRDHLISENRYHEIFDIERMTGFYKCKTAGCAIGECPAAFPDEWYIRYTKGGMQALLIEMDQIADDGGFLSFRCVEYFFGIDRTISRNLFLGVSYSCLHSEVTPRMVADRIDEVITTKTLGLKTVEED